MENEIITRAAMNGRALTLDPIVVREPLPMPVRRVENTLPAGLRINWMDGEENNPNGPVESFELTCGAGMGSPWLILAIHLKNGKTLHEVVNMADLIGPWINAALAAGPDPLDFDEAWADAHEFIDPVDAYFESAVAATLVEDDSYTPE